LDDLASAAACSDDWRTPLAAIPGHPGDELLL
jgi:hypothetical protein